MKMTVFWDGAPCSLVEVALMMEAVSTCETAINFYKAVWHNIPENSQLHPLSVHHTETPTNIHISTL
jgi:hypothetical protein